MAFACLFDLYKTVFCKEVADALQEHHLQVAETKHVPIITFKECDKKQIYIEVRTNDTELIFCENITKEFTDGWDYYQADCFDNWIDDHIGELYDRYVLLHVAG